MYTCTCISVCLSISLSISLCVPRYAVNIVLFLTALYLVATRGMGLRSVWVSLCAFQFVRLLQFSVRGVQIGLLPWPGRQ